MDSAVNDVIPVQVLVGSSPPTNASVGYRGGMGSERFASVVAANGLTARWCRRAGVGDFVVSGAGVWPLLGVLAGAAEGEAQEELVEALEVGAEQAHRAALELVGVMQGSVDLSAALGVWFADYISLHQDWVAELPEGVVERLTGQAQVDAWAAEHTRGLIEKFPLRITPDVAVVLATALVAKTEWRKPFTKTVLQPADGPWAGLRGRGLHRTANSLSPLALIDGPTTVTRVVVAGKGDLDVHLLAGPGEPGDVLAAGLDALGDRLPVRTELPPGTTGPGVEVTEVRSSFPGERLDITLPSFEVRSRHDLCATPDLFGITAAMRKDRGHFPRISATPLFISQGAQDVLARFTPTGFEAAAVTAFGMAVAGMPPEPRHTITVARVQFDRPFGFLAVHRDTGLAIVAGWVEHLQVIVPDERNRPQPDGPKPSPTPPSPFAEPW